MYEGKVAPWYFVSRMTTNEEYENVNFGDRTLAIFLGYGGYHFTTVDVTSSNANVNQNIEYGDIEAEWTYIYFSYSNVVRKAVALVNYVDNTVERLEFDVTHPVPTYLRFILGGTDKGNYPGFNGQFTRQVVKVGQGAFFDSAEDVITYAKQCNPKPGKDCTEKVVQNVWKDNKSFIVDERKPSAFVTDESAAFPEEYAVSGWFKWTGEDPQPYHLLFRLTQNQAEQNGNSQKLGDRTLAAFASFEGEQSLLFATYSYTDLNNHGVPNVHQSVPHRQGISTWHHIYFGYSRQERRALAMVWLPTGKVVVEFEQVNHFVSKQLFLYGAKDQFYPSYYGWIYKLQVHLCDFDPNHEPSKPFPTPIPPRPPAPHPHALSQHPHALRRHAPRQGNLRRLRQLRRDHLGQRR